MKKTIGIGMMALTLWVSQVALGEQMEGSTVWDGFSGFFNPTWSEDFSASIGAKVWMNEWTRDDFLSQEVSASSDDGSLVISARATNSQPDSKISEDIEPTPIPQLGIRYKWLFLTGSYYTETDFDFETTESAIAVSLDNDGDVIPLANSTIVNRTSGERFEWDVGGGIYVLPYVAILGGYKKVRQDIDETFTIINLLDPPNTEPDVTSGEANIEAKGPTIGIAASVPISQGFGIYGSYAHGFMDVELDQVDVIKRKRDGDYNVAELGFTYTHGTKQWAPHMPLSAATAYVGYRFQIIETDFNEPEQDRTDITKGFAAGVNLSF